MSEWTGGTIAETTDGAGPLALPVELEPAVSAFLLAATQWRWATAGRSIVVQGFPIVEMESRRVGLDYGGLRAALAFAGRRLTPEDFASVRVMEAHALKLLARS